MVDMDMMVPGNRFIANCNGPLLCPMPSALGLIADSLCSSCTILEFFLLISKQYFGVFSGFFQFLFLLFPEINIVYCVLCICTHSPPFHILVISKLQVQFHWLKIEKLENAKKEIF